jgi:hypothetical protein
MDCSEKHIRQETDLVIHIEEEEEEKKGETVYYFLLCESTDCTRVMESISWTNLFFLVLCFFVGFPLMIYYIFQSVKKEVYHDIAMFTMAPTLPNTTFAPTYFFLKNE